MSCGKADGGQVCWLTGRTAGALMVRLAVWVKAGMPRSTAVAWRAASSSIWVSLAVAAARLTLSPSASPAQACCRASVMRSRRLSRMPARRGRWAGSGRRREQRMPR